MKKVLSILLALIMTFSAMAIIASAAENELKVIVASDLHLSERSFVPFTGNTADDAYAHVPSSGQLTPESNAIITAFLENAAKSDCDVVFISGDITNAGIEEEHLIMAEKFAAFEAETGKDIYIIAGNHDLQRTDIDTFKSYYDAFGYENALAVDTLSTSYTADINSEYRLLAIDSIDALTGVANITPERYEWIVQQCEQAVADGKKIIAMMHHNLLEHFIFGKKIHTHGGVNNYEEMAEMLASYGVQHIFTGHTHDQDIAVYTSASGKAIYDVVTNSINGYPCQYRQVTFGDDVVFEEKTVTKIDISLLPDGLSAEAVALADSNFREYTKNCMWHGLRETFSGYLKPATLKDLLKLNEEENTEFVKVFDKVSTKLCEALNYPLYTKDEQVAGKSIESLAKANGNKIKASGYKDIIDLAIFLYQAHCLGDENYPIYSDEVSVLSTAVTTVLNYALADLTADEYTTALTFICTMFDVEIPSWIITFASSGLSNSQGVNLLVSSVLSPLMVEFTVDDAPADNNVTLPGYGKTAISSNENFFSKIMSFFQKIVDFLKSIAAYFQNLV